MCQVLQKVVKDLTVSESKNQFMNGRQSFYFYFYYKHIFLHKFFLDKQKVPAYFSSDSLCSIMPGLKLKCGRNISGVKTAFLLVEVSLSKK